MFIEDGKDFAYINAENLDAYHHALPKGVYDIVIQPFQPIKFSPTKFESDKYVKMYSDTYTRTRKEIENYFNPEITARMREYGFLHKRGIIIHGPPGTGKSAFVVNIAHNIVETEDVVVLMQPDLDGLDDMIDIIRKSDPTRCIVIIWDEFDSIVRYNEEALLRLTDGIESHDNLLIIGMTNNLHRLNERVKDRPSRFGLVIELGLPEESDRVNYIKSVFSDISDPVVVETLAKISKGKSLDHLKENCIQFAIMGTSLEEIALRNDYNPEEEESEGESEDTKVPDVELSF